MERLRSTMASAMKKETPKSHRQPSHQRSAGPPVLRLQRIFGNRAVQRLLRSGAVQARLELKSNDECEQEASRRTTDSRVPHGRHSVIFSAGRHATIPSACAQSAVKKKGLQPKPLANSSAPLHISTLHGPVLARAVFYEGFNLHRDINFFDPTTAPAGKLLGLGHTEMMANGSPIHEENMEPKDKLDLLFPLPNYTKSYSVSGAECIKSESKGSLHIASNIRVLQNPPWAAIVAHGELVNILGGKLAQEPGCSAGNVDLTFTAGSPSADAGFQQWLISAELQHANDHKCLVEKYLKGYENDVNALPSTIPSGYVWFGDCNARLDERLKRAQRWNAMIAERRAWIRELDRQGGAHTPTFTIDTRPGCVKIIVTLHKQPLEEPQRGSCNPWSPP